MNIALIEAYFDGTDYNESIKYFVNDRYYWFIYPDAT
jgi:hypothetical protein